MKNAKKKMAKKELKLRESTTILIRVFFFFFLNAFLVILIWLKSNWIVSELKNVCVCVCWLNVFFRNWFWFGFVCLLQHFTNTIPCVLVVVTVAEVGANDKLVLVVFTVAWCCICCCTPPLFDLCDVQFVIYACFI